MRHCPRSTGPARPRGGIVLALVAALAVACAGDSTNSSSPTTVAPTSASPATSAPVPSSAPTVSPTADPTTTLPPVPGVDADGVTVGVSVMRLPPIAIELGVDTGDAGARWSALVGAWNERGGLGGRPIRARPTEWTVLDDASAVALCPAFTQEADLFAVLGPLPRPAVDCVVEAGGVPWIGNGPTPLGLDLDAVAATVGPEPERALVATARGLTDRGLLDGARVAVHASPTLADSVEDDVVPVLIDAGVEVIDVSIADSPRDAIEAEALADATVERWRVGGVDTLLTFDEPAWLLSRLPGLDFSPRIVLGPLASTDFDVAALAQLGVGPDVLTGALGVAGPTWAVDLEHPDVRWCLDVLETARPEEPINVERRPGAIANGSPAISECLTLHLLDRLVAAAGPTLDLGSARAELGGFELAGLAASLTATKQGASDTYALVAYDPEGSRFVVTDRFESDGS